VNVNDVLFFSEMICGIKIVPLNHIILSALIKCDDRNQIAISMAEMPKNL